MEAEGKGILSHRIADRGGYHRYHCGHCGSQSVAIKVCSQRGFSNQLGAKSSQFAGYSATTGAGTYATSLGSLSTSELVDSVLGSGTKDGYRFVVSTGSGNTEFSINARPLTYGSMGTRSFFADESRVIRYNTADARATTASPPLGKLS